MKLLKVNLEKIKPYENNPRKNNQAVKDVARFWLSLNKAGE